MSDLAKVLDAFNSALSVVKSVADTPGINILPYAAAVSSAIAALQTAYTVGKNIVPYITAIKETYTGGVPTQAELDAKGAALDAKIAELEAKADAPLPPKEEGEPE